jgi:hypothetical protein
VALAASEGTAAEAKKVDNEKSIEPAKEESSNVEKRGLHGSIGDYSFGGHDGGHDFGGSSGYGGHHEHHEHIKTITIEKKVPVPYTVHKHVPYTVEKKVPYEVKVPVPQPYEVIKKYPYTVKEYVKYPVHVPQPYTVVKKIPYGKFSDSLLS